MAKKVTSKKTKAVKASKAKTASPSKKKAVIAKKAAIKPAPKKARPTTKAKVLKKSSPTKAKPVKAIKAVPSKKVVVSKPQKATAAKIILKKTVKPLPKMEVKKSIVKPIISKIIKKVVPVISKVVTKEIKKVTTPAIASKSIKSAPIKSNNQLTVMQIIADSKSAIVNKNISQELQPNKSNYVKPQVNKIKTSTVVSTNSTKRTTDMSTQGKNRYSDAELTEFKDLILQKLEEKRRDLEMLRGTIDKTDDHGTDDTAHTFKPMEDGSDVLTKEEVAQLATRQKKIIQHLENALFRIENKTYGICRVTGNLIPKERLRSVPHATTTVEAKMSEAPHA
jgi:RNA polymerase-binding transcription factor DksA